MKFWLLSLSLLTLSGFILGEKAHAGQFEPVYTDSKNQLSWSKALPRTYSSNGCVDANGLADSSKCTFETLPDGSRQVKVDDSNAAKACKAVGARLPTESEFESLIRSFDHTEESYGPILTKKGMVEMSSVFGDSDHWVWTSSVYPEVSSAAYVFSGVWNGGILRVYDRHTYIFPFDVWCVVGR